MTRIPAEWTKQEIELAGALGYEPGEAAFERSILALRDVIDERTLPKPEPCPGCNVVDGPHVIGCHDKPGARVEIIKELDGQLQRLPKPPEDLGDGPTERVNWALALIASGVDRIRCSACSSPVPAAVVVRAWIECPECVTRFK